MKLFSVKVIRTWTATLPVLVWAENSDDATEAAMAEEDLNSFDAWDDGAEAVARLVDPKLLDQLPKQPDELLLVPDPLQPGLVKPTWQVVDTLAEFIAFLSTEESERLRIAAIERNNGQIPLPTLIP